MKKRTNRDTTECATHRNHATSAEAACLRGQVDTAVESVTRDAMSSGAHARCQRPNARHSLPFASYFSTVESDGVARQEAQIVQSALNLDDFLPRITRPLGSLTSRRSQVRVQAGTFGFQDFEVPIPATYSRQWDGSRFPTSTILPRQAMNRRTSSRRTIHQRMENRFERFVDPVRQPTSCLNLSVDPTAARWQYHLRDKEGSDEDAVHDDPCPHGH